MLDTTCFIPTYAMDSKETAEKCATQGGRITAAIITFIIIILILSTYYSANKKYDEAVDKENVRKPNIAIYLIIGGILIAITWLTMPALTRFFSEVRWTQNETMINNYMKQGMTRAEAVNRISTLREAQAQRDATLEAGREQAQATNNLAAALMNRNR
jgi:succinate dehydrogenase hydrophobic anchor subunit